MNIAQALAIRGETDSYERQENAWLLEHLLGLNSLALKYHAERILSAEQEQHYLAALARLEAGEPLAYITGSQPFWTLDLNVTPDTLVPRPDTEILVEHCLQLCLADDAMVLDLGTGTGAIALALASERPHWQIIATDIYEPTLKVAQSNALKHDLNQVQFRLGAWFSALGEQASAKFDLIVSNPPYIDATDEHMKALHTEPQRALVAQQQGLADLHIIIAHSKVWLKPKAWLVLEHGYDQGGAVRKIFAQENFTQIQTIQDYGGNDRVTLAQHS